MNKIGIIQPGYLPWLGFFEQIIRCDTFVYLDDVQYTKNDWRNRNRIKTKDGIQWLSVPVSYKFGQNIKEVHINNSSAWQKKHFQSLKTCYGKSRFFNIYSEELSNIFNKTWSYLIDLDISTIHWLIEKLGLNLKLFLSSELSINTKDKQLRLIEICNALGCNFFYEGRSGQDYIEVELFKNHGITVAFQEYHHPYYNQLWLKEQGFISHLSIVDLLFNHGNDSQAIITGEKVIQKPEEISIRQANYI